MSKQFLGTRSPARRTDGELTVLLVAPSSTVEKLAAGLRDDVGHVLSTSSLGNACRLLERSNVDCVVSELEFDDGDGISLLQEVRQRDSSLPFVVWTADGDETVASEAIAAGAADYIPRAEEEPIEFGAVTERIRRVVTSREERRGRDASTLPVVADLNQRLSRTDTIDEGLHVVLTDLCESTGWEYGELWVPSRQREEVKHAASYQLEDEFRDFIEVTRTTTFKKGEGLPGRVWATEDTEWIRDVSELSPDKYIRTGIAETSNLCAAFGIPVTIDGGVAAVLAYYLTEPREFDGTLAAIAETLAASFGTLIASSQTGTREVSQRLEQRYKRPLERARTAGEAVRQVDTTEETVRTIVDAAQEMVDASFAVGYLYDEGIGDLVPTAVSGASDVDVADCPRISAGENAVWQAFVDRTVNRGDGNPVIDIRSPARTGTREAIALPIGKRGALVVAVDSATPDEFGVDALQLLCSIAGETITRREQSIELDGLGEELRRRTRELEGSRQLIGELPATVTAIVEAGSRAGLARELCASLVTLDGIDGAWLGTPDPERNALQVTHQVGMPEPYFANVPLDLEEESTFPAVQAARNRGPSFEENVAVDPQKEGWKRTALLYDFGSVASVPILYDGILYGVVTTVSNRPHAFGEQLRMALDGVGTLVGHAFNAIDQRNTLLADETVRLTLHVRGADDPFSRLATRSGATLRIQNVTGRSDGYHLVHFSVDDGNRGDLTAQLEQTPAVRQDRLISDGESPLFEAVVVDDCIATTVAELGADVREVTVTEQGSRIDLSIPRNRDKQQFIGCLEEKYSDVQLRACASNAPSTTSLATEFDRRLTDRQHEILKAAYHGGFFDQPRESTGTEIAESLGISQPAFSTQLRTIQRILLESVYDD